MDLYIGLAVGMGGVECGAIQCQEATSLGRRVEGEEVQPVFS